MATTPDPRERFTAPDPRRQFRAPSAGGTNRGGVMATQQTSFGVGDTAGPLARLMDPYIKEKQQKGFIKGYIEQAKAGAEAQVIDADNPVSSLFGPSFYEEGASTFTALAKVSDWKTAAVQDMDNLKKLSDDDFNKWVGTELEGFNTGNRWADDIISGQMMKEVPALVQLRTEARYAWQQAEASSAYRTGIKAAMQSYNTYAGTRAAQPGIYEETETDVSQKRNLAGILTQAAPGQTESAWKRDLMDTLRLDVEEGNFHAYNLVEDLGLLDYVDSSDRESMTTNYENNAKKAKSDMLRNNEPLRARLATLTIRQERAASEFWKPSAMEPKKISPNEVQAELIAIDEELSRLTGVRGVSYFSTEKLLAEGDTVIKGMARAAEAASSRAATQAASLEEKATIKKIEADVATTAWLTGNSREALLGGTPESVIDVLAANSAATGDVETLAQNYATNPKAWPSAERTILGPIKASHGVGYTNALQDSMKLFNAMRGRDLAMAMDYYGEEYARLEQIDRSIKAGQLPEQAWNQVYKRENIGNMREWARPAQRKEAETATLEWGKKHLNGSMVGRLGLTDNRALNDSGLVAFQASTTKQLAIYQDSTLAMEDQVASVYNKVIANGSFQHYGRFGWEAPVGTPKLHDVVKYPKEVVTPVLEATVSGELSRRNPNAGKRMNSMEFLTSPIGRDGEVKITVFETLPDGTEVFADITSAMLRDRAERYVKIKAEERDAVNFVIRGKPGADPGKVFYDNMKRTTSGGNHEDKAPPPNAQEIGKKLLKGLGAVKG